MSSFALPIRFIGGARGQAVRALYQYCRTLDDIADLNHPNPHAALDDWQQRLLAGASALPAELATAVVHFNLPVSELQLILDGVRLDAEGRSPPADRAALAAYCRCVAGAVGVLLVRILAPPDSRHDQFAILAGEALQLTNILRDVAEDQAQGRCYLPKTYMVDNKSHAINMLYDESDILYKQSWALFRQCDRRSLWPAAAMIGIYAHLLGDLKRRRCLTERPKISIATALTCCARARLGLYP